MHETLEEKDCAILRWRRSIRLRHYDCTQPGAYFVTICAWHRECLFGEIVDGEMRLNDLGRIAQEEWLQSAVIRQEIGVDETAIMPNHLHGIVFVAPTDAREERDGAGAAFPRLVHCWFQGRCNEKDQPATWHTRIARLAAQLL